VFYMNCKDMMEWMCISDGADQIMWDYKSKQCKFVKKITNYKKKSWMAGLHKKAHCGARWTTLAHDRFKVCVLVSDRAERLGSVPEG